MPSRCCLARSCVTCVRKLWTTLTGQVFQLVGAGWHAEKLALRMPFLNPRHRRQLGPLLSSPGRGPASDRRRAGWRRALVNQQCQAKTTRLHSIRRTASSHVFRNIALQLPRVKSHQQGSGVRAGEAIGRHVTQIPRRMLTCSQPAVDRLANRTGQEFVTPRGNRGAAGTSDL